MSEHRYILEPYKGMKTRHHCPGCQHRDKTFSLYIDTETGENLHPTVGRCNRESNCGYHYTPKQYFQDNNISFDMPQVETYRYKPVTPQKKPVSFIPVEVFKASLKAHETNNFVKFLIHLFGVEVASQLVSRYFIATSKHWNGATVFWQIDTHGKVRTGKIMLYSPTTGKRVKEPFNHINWVHSLLKQPEFELRQCLFGEHLLSNDKNKPVAIVESEKTAVIASVYLPQFVWVAVGSLTNLNAEKCSILKGRTVTLFPDLNGFEKWSSKAKELSHLNSFQVSDLLERKASVAERKQGLDLADYLTRFDFREFTPPNPGASEPPPTNEAEPAIIPVFELLKKATTPNPATVQKPNEVEPLPLTKKQIFTTVGEVFDWIRVNKLDKSDTHKREPENWEPDINELENYFAGIAIPKQPVKLNQCSTITDCSKFIENHFATVKANNGNPTFLPNLNRLQELKQVLTSNLN